MTEQNRQTNARLDRIEQAIAEQGRQIIGRIDSLTRWLVGMQVASLIALGTLILLACLCSGIVPPRLQATATSCRSPRSRPLKGKVT
ncbi:MAG: hypothetical protein F4049_15260 [Gemmatimonadetes bacterium]|nr:hypothetical protein [Gemmatimonadota bacterium]